MRHEVRCSDALLESTSQRFRMADAETKHRATSVSFRPELYAFFNFTGVGMMCDQSAQAGWCGTRS